MCVSVRGPGGDGRGRATGAEGGGGGGSAPPRRRPGAGRGEGREGAAQAARLGAALTGPSPPRTARGETPATRPRAR